MLNNGNVRTQQCGVDRSLPAIGAVDVVRVNAYQGHTGIQQPLRQPPREMGKRLEILIRSPVPIPRGLYQHRLAANIAWLERQTVDRARRARLHARDDALQVSERLQRQL